MLIAAGVLIQFVRFMQITLLIFLPVLVIAVAVTIWNHYRKKKKDPILVPGIDAVQRLIAATPDGLNYEAEDADYVQYDQSGLIREYKSKLIYSHARYTALQKDYESLQDKCNTLLMQVKTTLPKSKKLSMKNMHADDQAGHEKTALALATLEKERNDLLAKLELVNSSYQALEKENQSLAGQVELLSSPGGDNTAVVQHWQEESTRLREQVAEQDYLRDVLEEKKIQIGFLQEQLEQRIRNFHQSERQVGELKDQLAEANRLAFETKTALEVMTGELREKEAETIRLREGLDEKDVLITEKDSAITWLENTLRETREQNEMLNATAADSQDLVLALQEAMAGEQSKLVHLEQKLESNRQVLKKLFHELAFYIDDDPEQSPVIELKAAYVNAGS